MEISESLAQKTYTLKDISKAVAKAREEILGTSQADSGPYKDVGDARIYSRVISAQQKAKKDGGIEWKQNRKYGGPIELDYDADHTTGILDSLKDRATVKATDYEKEGITPEIVNRAEQILFGIPSVEKPNTF